MMKEKNNDRPFSFLQADALDLLAQLEPETVDAFVIDPPFCSGGATEAGRSRAPGQGLRSETLRSGRFSWFQSDNMTTGGLLYLLRAVGCEALRVLKPGGSLVMFMDWRQQPLAALTIESAGLRYQNLLFWNKLSMGLGTGFRHQHETILHFTKGVGAYHDKGTSNVLDAPRIPTADRDHPTEKPVDLIRKIIRVVSPPGGVVLDCFAGSGVCAEACLEEGRVFIGGERDPVYFQPAVDRADRAFEQKQRNLFAA